MKFVGRQRELATLADLKRKNTASIVCILGRRRIGKSYLIQKFGTQFTSYIEIQGLGPHLESSTLQAQLNHFATELSHQFNTRKNHFEDWDDAFIELSNLTQKGEHLILLDEISWMASGDPLFSAKLKSAWDSRLKKNPKLILALCGSVSSWIENNLLKNTNFEGRISSEINLKELSLPEANSFFDPSMGPYEKMIILSITGGVPKYLEEVASKDHSMKRLARLCFSEPGILFKDFEKIFLDIFQRRSKTFERIIRMALEKKLTPQQLAHQCKINFNSDFIEHLHILELSGFISRDYYFKPDTNGEASKFSHIRVKDNYLRFYMKVIAPLKKKILVGGKIVDDIQLLKGIEPLLGYQFENLLLANRSLIHERLKIDNAELNASAPYVQRKTLTNRGACQIDLLIHTRFDVFYVCEFKCQKQISDSIIKEVQKKIDVFKVPKRSSIKPVLIYLGELEPASLSKMQDFFYQIIAFEELLQPK